MNTDNKNSVFFWAILFVSAGIIFLLRNFGLFNFKFPVDIISWRLIPLIIGVTEIFCPAHVEILLPASMEKLVNTSIKIKHKNQ
jgi:hypothetical protein